MYSRCLELAALFLKLGAISFGGPAVHIAVMEEEVVERRKWLSREHFLDLVGATNLIPGPNSTEMAIHVGYVRAGLPGLVVAGVSFILPAVLITTLFAFLYVEYGQTPQMQPILFGIKPAVIAIIVSAGWRLARTAIRHWVAAAVAIGVAAASFTWLPEIILLLFGGLIGMAILLWLRRGDSGGGGAPSPKTAGAALIGLFTGFWSRGASASLWAQAAVLGDPAGQGRRSLLTLGLMFLKVGALLFGSGYVLIAYLEGDLVDNYGWLSQDELVEAVAIGQLTPGPILSTATFIGYVVMYQEGGHGSGLAGAAVATLCIFIPSFLFVAATNPIVPKLRKWRWTAAFLDAVNAASLGLMAAVTLRLGANVFYRPLQTLGVNWPAVLIAVLALAAVLRWKVRPLWIVIGGAAAGVACSLLGIMTE